MFDTHRNGPDWSRIDTVMLDMDGTILDLSFDNQFWQHTVPQAYADHHGLELPAALDRLMPWFTGLRGTLDWYCLDFWSQRLEMDIGELKLAEQERIGWLDGAEDAVLALRARCKQLWLTTNAHRRTLQIKADRTGLAPLFDAQISSHDFGAPKEHAAFWTGMLAAHPFDPARTLFVDDSEPVRAAARAFGIGQVWAIAKPDSTQPMRPAEDGPWAERLADLTV